jgi:ATP/maltotriose-dependent transcriptional regulator MalT
MIYIIDLCLPNTRHETVYPAASAERGQPPPPARPVAWLSLDEGENDPARFLTHLVIATREDPQFPLARLRARDQVTEVRAADLRFTPSKAAAFLNRVMGLHLSAEDVSALERRTEGWIAGLQLAALSMQGHEDVTVSGQATLDYLDHANLFLVPLDNERRW